MSADPADVGPNLQPKAMVARACNLTVRRLEQLVREGVIPSGERGRLPLLGSMMGYIRYLQTRASEGSKKLAEDARYKEAQADLRRLEYEQKSGDLVQFSAVRDAIHELGSKAGQLLDGIGQSISHEIVGESDPVTVAALIDERIADARELIAGLRIRLKDDRARKANHNGRGVGRRKPRLES